MWTNDLKQEVARLGNPSMPEQPSGLHNALADARHVRVMWDFVTAPVAVRQPGRLIRWPPRWHWPERV
jgi:hypothetical protein